MMTLDDMKLLRQHPSEVVDLNGWDLDDEFPIGPTGAKPKRIFICPSPAPHGFLIGGHRYLFKEPSGPYAMQIWSEVIAYELAKRVHVLVPPAFLARAPGNGSPGVLIEFFYGYKDRPPARLISGIDRLQARGYPISYKRGSLKDNINVCRGQAAPSWRSWWAETIAFDALIGNTDRHSENWGFLANTGPHGGMTFSMAPAFDNGTSLGFVTREQDLEQALSEARFLRFIERGCHHYGWTSADRASAQHVALCRSLVAHVTGTRATMRRVATVSDANFDEIVSWCREFNYSVPFSALRARFVATQLRARRNSILKTLAEGVQGHGTLGGVPT
ncbi:HipA domain-containing protein [Reyranella sp. CPCC 100927]|uniref:HipA domain-containing protein n=1 Tax=Reyranella sp. CPCC 100927 TaxID=2599616 RepID=UPI0015B41734|nr:HipA domain-containing protein [Reyranella sp. CPCC 100927]